MPRFTFVLPALIVLSAAAAAAQVPAGHYAVSTFALGNLKPGGVFLVDPRVPGNPTSITGLSSELTTSPDTRGFGANSIAVRADGTLLVGEIGPDGTAIDLHWLIIANNQVVQDRKTLVGTVAGSRGGGGINQIVPLADGTALLSVSDIGTSPLLIVDPAAQTVTPVTMTPQPTGLCNAVGVDATGQNAYFAMLVAASPTGDIYRVPIPGGGTPVHIGQSMGIPALSVDRMGRLVHGTMTTISEMDATTGVVTTIGTAGSNVNAMNLERVTDEIVYVLNGLGPEGPAVKRMTQAGVSTTLTNALTGVPSGIDVFRTPMTIGVDTPGGASFRWQVEPNPGGLPRVGSPNFSITVATSGPSAAGLLYVSPVSTNIKILGVQLYLDPTTMFNLGLVPNSGTVPLPIPNNAAFAGSKLFFQSFHSDAGAPQGIASSSGLSVTVIQ